MITIRGNKGKPVLIPDQWDELTPELYTAVSGYIYEMVNGRMDVLDFRLKLLESLAGYRRSKQKFTAEEQRTINENLFRISEKIRFCIKPKYHNPEVLDVLAQPLRELLKEKFPFEIYDQKFRAELKMVENLLQYGASIRLGMKKNPMEVLSVFVHEFSSKYNFYFGPYFMIDRNNLAVTDMRAGEFVDAYEYYSLYQRTQHMDYLDRLVFTLYRSDRKSYEPVVQLPKVEFSMGQKYGVFLFFQNLMEYLVNNPLFGILFNRTTDRPAPGISIGMVSTIYNLSAAGYGTKQDIAQLNLADYLSMMVKQMIDAVNQLKTLDKSPTEIAKELEIPVENVLKMQT